MQNWAKSLALLGLLFHCALTVNVLTITDNWNQELKTSLATAFRNLQDDDIETDRSHFDMVDDEEHIIEEQICSMIGGLIDSGSPPDLILDFTDGGDASDRLKRVQARLNLPTVTTSALEMGGMVAEWDELTPEQEKYMIHVRSIDEAMPLIARDLAELTNTTDAVIFYDETFGLQPHVLTTFLDQPVRHMTHKIVDDDDKVREQFDNFYRRSIKNYFIMASQKNIHRLMKIGAEFGYFGRYHSWWLFTKDEDTHFEPEQFQNMSVMWIKPVHNPLFDLKAPQMNEYGYGDGLSLIEQAFYLDLSTLAVKAVADMMATGAWPNMTHSKCNEAHDVKPRNIDLLSALKATEIEESWGPFEFTSNGNSLMKFPLQMKHYYAFDHMLKESHDIGTWMSGVPGEFSFEDGMEYVLLDYSAKRLFRIVTVVQPPFMEWNETLGRYEGFCYEMLLDIVEYLGIEYTLYEVPEYGLMYENGTYDGLIGELATGKADIGIGAISIMAERELVVDFTVPWYDLVGVAVLMKKMSAPTNLFNFLVVFSDGVWWSIAGTWLISTVVIWLLDRYSPYSYQNNEEYYQDDDEQRYFHLRECAWFVLCGITPQGGGEAPKSPAARFATATWWFYSFIIVTQYTANLAAFLCATGLARPVNDLEDLTLQTKISYSVVNGSLAAKYFENMARIEDKFMEVWQGLNFDSADELTDYQKDRYHLFDIPVSKYYTKVWNTMKKNGLPQTVEEGLRRVRRSTAPNIGYAMLVDATDAAYWDMTNCDLQMVGQEFSNKPYGFAVPNGSWMKDRLNDGILDLLNRRRLERFRSNWWRNNPRERNCKMDDGTSIGISIFNIGGLFMCIYAGFTLSCICMYIEYKYFINKPWDDEEEETGLWRNKPPIKIVGMPIIMTPYRKIYQPRPKLGQYWIDQEEQGRPISSHF